MVTVLDYDERGQLVPDDKPTAMVFPEDQPNLFLYHRLQGCKQVRKKGNVGLHTTAHRQTNRLSGTKVGSLHPKSFGTDSLASYSKILAFSFSIFQIIRGHSPVA